jgi:hypothetical protein
MDFLGRYRDGEHQQVWADLLALEEEVRFATYFPHAYAVAKETMRRVRDNIGTLVARLRAIGYQFARPDSAYLPSDRRAVEQIKPIEESLGPLPLSLRAFYEVVGSIDFRQSTDQLIQYHRPERSTATELELLGEEDPLVVAPLDELAEQAASANRRLYFCFAPDEFHKANSSGGENYHVWLPDPRADFEIVGMYGTDERFVEYLRATLAQGGFRGHVETLEHDESRCRKVAPRLGIVRQLASDLLPI